MFVKENSYLSSSAGILKVTWDYIIADYARNKRSFSIGAATVFLVVMFLSLLQNVLSRSGLIFLKLAEDQAGSYDLLLTPDTSASTQDFLNYDYINASLSGYSDITGVAARWIWPVNVSQYVQTGDPSLTATLFVMDTQFEQDIGLASNWPHRPLSDGEVHASSSLLRALNVYPNVGQKIHLQSNILDLLNALGKNQSLLPPTIQIPVDLFPLLPPQTQLLLSQNLNVSSFSTTVTVDTATFLGSGTNLTFQIDAYVIDSIDSTYGKYPSALGNVVVFEKKALQNLLDNPSSLIISGISSNALNINLNLDLNTMAISVVVNANDRVSIYSSSTNVRKARISQIADGVFQRLGIDYSASVTAVLSVALDATRVISIFLDELFFTVLTVLVILSVILVGSLLLSDAEEKTFEYGILRSLGLKSSSLILLLCLQSAIFAIPGIISGMILCYTAFVPVGYILSSFVGANIDVSIDPSAVGLGVSLGLILPIIGVIVPIRRSLSKTIRDSLDVYHNTVYDTQISVVKIENIRLSLTNTIISLILIIIGIMVYYFIPLSFALGNLENFFRILSVILLGMFLGLVMMSDALQFFFQTAFVHLITFIGRDYKLTQIVLKNSSGHISRNRKTSLMFTLCLGYLIFSATMFELQIQSFSSNLEWVYGADLSITAPSFDVPLPETKLRQYMDTNMMDPDTIVEGYTFISFSLSSYYPVASVTVSRLSAITEPAVYLYGLESNFLDVSLRDFFAISEINWDISTFEYDSNGYNYVSGLFQNLTSKITKSPPNVLNSVVRAGSSQFGVNSSAYSTGFPIFLSDSLRDYAFINTDSDIIVSTSMKSGVQFSYLSQPLIMLKQCPAFSQITRLTTQNSPALVSMVTFLRLLNDIQISTKGPPFTTPPKYMMLLKLKDGVNSRFVESLSNELSNVLANSSFQVQNLIARIADTTTAANFLLIMFYIVAFVGIVFSFFVLLLSFTANIRENSWEIGVLRAIGLSTWSIIRLFVYEALSVVLSSIVLGTALGIVTAVAFSLQSNLFSELPFVFSFPATLFALVSLASIGFAVLGSYFPIIAYTQKPISIILRG